MSRRSDPRRGRRPSGTGDRRTVRMVWILAASALGLLVVWRLGHVIAGGGSEAPASTGAASTPSRTPSTTTGPTERSVSAIFPAQVRGARLELKVFGLGNTPESCTPADLSMGGDVRTVYHFDCRRLEAPASTAYFFLVRLTNLANVTVPAELSGFTVSTSDGASLAALDATGATYQRPFLSTDLLPEASVKGWVTFDGSKPFTPFSLSYQDGGQTLTVHFRGTWA